MKIGAKLVLVILACLNIVQAEPVQEESTNSYPLPPWQQTVWASGYGFNRSMASFDCISDARYRVGHLERVCRDNHGAASSGYPFCSFCNMLGNRWRCTDTIWVSCHELEGESDLEGLE